MPAISTCRRPLAESRSVKAAAPQQLMLIFSTTCRPAGKRSATSGAACQIGGVGRRRIALALAIAAAVLLVSVVVGPGLVARRVATRVSRSLGTPLHVGWLRWNPFAGRWTLDHLHIAADRGPAALSARRVSARIHLWDALRGTYRVRALVLDGARLRLRATPAGWQLPLPAGPPEVAATPAAGLDLARVLRLAADTPVADIRGRVDVRAKYDEAGDGAPTERRITGSASGRDVALRAQGVPGLWLRGVQLSRFDFDLGRRSVA